jgi:hypothetical protein
MKLPSTKPPVRPPSPVAAITHPAPSLHAQRRFLVSLFDTLFLLCADQIVHAMLRPEKQDKAFHLSLFNHILSCTMVCLFQFFDVLTYGN